MKLNSTHVTIAVSLLIIVLIALFIAFIPSKNSTKGEELIPFAKCLADSGAKFYGAFWCPHCQNQKTLFGKAAKELPYVECSTPDMRGQTPVCASANIASYPTWIFADGSKQSGEMTLEMLSEKTQCPLVQQ